MRAGRPAARRLLRGGTLVAVAMMLFNLGAYGFTILAAHRLAPADLGAVAALLGLVLIGNVVASGLQTMAARRVSAHPEHAGNLSVAALRSGLWAAAGFLALAVVLALPLDWAFHLTGWMAPLLAVATLAPISVTGAISGVLQGCEAWGRLSAVYVANGVGRLGIGGVLVVARPDAVGAMLGLVLGALLPVAVGGYLLRRLPLPETAAASPDDTALAGIAAEVGHNAHTLAAFFTLSNLDALAARVLLPTTLSGSYAAGLIVTKACLFLPQFVIVVLFPSMATAAHTSRVRWQALAAVAGLGGLAALAVFVLQDLVVTFIGGSKYAAVGPLAWRFALTGTVLACIQTLVMEELARSRRRVVWVLWAAVAGLGGLATVVAHDVASLVTLMLGGLVTLLGGWLLRSRSPSQEASPATPA